MSILNYIEKIKRENEGPRITAQEPRNMADGGRIGFYKAGLVTQGKREGQWVIRGVPASINPGGSIFFPSETAANEWISTRPGKGDPTLGERSKTWKRKTKGQITTSSQKKLDNLIEIINNSNNIL